MKKRKAPKSKWWWVKWGKSQIRKSLHVSHPYFQNGTITFIVERFFDNRREGEEFFQNKQIKYCRILLKYIFYTHICMISHRNLSNEAGERFHQDIDGNVHAIAVNHWPLWESRMSYHMIHLVCDDIVNENLGWWNGT